MVVAGRRLDAGRSSERRSARAALGPTFATRHGPCDPSDPRTYVDRTDPSQSQVYERLVGELIDLADGGDIALLQASEHLAYHGLRDLDRNKHTPGSERSRQLLQAVEALRDAAHAARDRLAKDDPGVRAFREAQEAFRNRQAEG